MAAPTPGAVVEFLQRRGKFDALRKQILQRLEEEDVPRTIRARTLRVVDDITHSRRPTPVRSEQQRLASSVRVTVHSNATLGRSVSRAVARHIADADTRELWDVVEDAVKKVREGQLEQLRERARKRPLPVTQNGESTRHTTVDGSQTQGPRPLSSVSNESDSNPESEAREKKVSINNVRTPTDKIQEEEAKETPSDNKERKDALSLSEHMTEETEEIATNDSPRKKPKKTKVVKRKRTQEQPDASEVQKEDDTKQCTLCGTKRTSLWRKDEGRVVCNACGVRLRRNKAANASRKGRDTASGQRTRKPQQALERERVSSEEEKTKGDSSESDDLSGLSDF